eukprot:356074-Chlamydomonas_euryale.AAC.2
MRHATSNDERQPQATARSSRGACPALCCPALCCPACCGQPSAARRAILGSRPALALPCSAAVRRLPCLVWAAVRHLPCPLWAALPHSHCLFFLDSHLASRTARASATFRPPPDPSAQQWRSAGAHASGVLRSLFPNEETNLIRLKNLPARSQRRLHTRSQSCLTAVKHGANGESSRLRRPCAPPPVPPCLSPQPAWS